MTSDATALVTEFCAAFGDGKTPDELLAYFADDAVYHNIPVDPAVGHDAILALLNMFMGAMVLALVGYALFPTAPPRMFPAAGFTDTISTFTNTNQDSSFASLLVNPYAAVPSMHVAFSLMISVPAMNLVRSAWARALWSMYPLVVFFVIVVTANHYWFDAAAGAAVASGLAAGAAAPGCEPPMQPEARKARPNTENTLFRFMESLLTPLSSTALPRSLVSDHPRWFRSDIQGPPSGVELGGSVRSAHFPPARAQGRIFSGFTSRSSTVFLPSAEALSIARSQSRRS